MGKLNIASTPSKSSDLFVMFIPPVVKTILKRRMLLLSGEKIAPPRSRPSEPWMALSIRWLGVYWIGNLESKMEIPLRRNRMRFAFVLTAALALAVVVFAADVAGTWKGTLETPMGPMENTIVLAADGASLTGSVKTDFFEAKVENGKLDGDKVSFEINIEFGKLVYEGTVAGDDLKLNVTGPDGSKIPLNAKRQK